MPSKQDIDRIMQGRQAVKRYHEALQAAYSNGEPERQPELLKELLTELEKLGFKSTEEFNEFDRAICMQDLAECIRFEGTCDGCIDRLPRGCPDVAYQCRTQQDAKSVTGRTPYDPTIDPVLSYRHAIALRADYFKSLPPRRAGLKFPMFPKCKIMVVYTKSPSLKWLWLE